MIAKIKKLKLVCMACGECLTMETNDGFIRMCTEYGAGYKITETVVKCSNFFLSRDLCEDLSTKERKVIENHFKPEVFKK